MQAVINSLTGTALLLEGQSASVLQVDRYPRTTVVRIATLPLVLGDARNVEVVDVASVNEAFEILKRERLREECLDVALILLDPDVSDATRRDAVSALEEMLIDENVCSWLEGVLYSAPLPACADGPGALLIAKAGGASAVGAMLSRLFTLQDVIRRVRDAWTLVCERLLSSPIVQQEATVLAARSGISRKLVLAAESAEHDEFRFAALQILQPLPNYRRIVEELINELHLVRRSRRRHQPSGAVDATDRESRDARRHVEPLSFDRTAAFASVVRQKDAIVNHMRQGRLDLVRRYVDELVESQLPRDHRGEKTSMSLCDLAMEAKSQGLFELQLDLAMRAVSVRYQDSWAWAQVGDALLILNRFDEALAAYRNARDFGSYVIGATGRAQALLKMGRHQEALNAYDEVIGQHSADVVVKNARAEVLKVMGKFDEARVAYDDVIRAHPDDVVAKTGRAEVLKSMGKLHDALLAYDDVIRVDPGDVVALNGRAELLKSMGKLDEAFIAYEDVIRFCPADGVAKNGRADVLKSMGKFEEALRAYDDVIREHPTNIFAKTGQAELLKSMGKLEEALIAYDDAIRAHPTNVVMKNGRAEALKWTGKLDEALVAYDEVILAHPTNVVAKAGRAEVLKSMGKFGEALAAYEDVIREYPTNIFAKTGKAEVLKSMGKFAEALEAYDDLIREHPTNIFAKTGHAEVLKSMGKLEEALAAYDDTIREHPTDVVAKNGRTEVLKSMGKLREALVSYDEVISEHPTNVVAKNGRAEVLKSMGNLGDALVAYGEVIRQHPNDAVARNGRAAVLCALGRFEETLTLTAISPRTRQDWVALHIRGMAMIRARRINEAVEILVRGSEENPFVADRDVFKSGLALARVHQRAYQAALESLENVREMNAGRVASFLRGHSAGALGDFSGAARFLSAAGPARNERERELKAELERRFVRNEAPMHDEDWLIDHEIDCMLLAA